MVGAFEKYTSRKDALELTGWRCMKQGNEGDQGAEFKMLRKMSIIIWWEKEMDRDEWRQITSELKIHPTL